MLCQCTKNNDNAKSEPMSMCIRTTQALFWLEDNIILNCSCKCTRVNVLSAVYLLSTYKYLSNMYTVSVQHVYCICPTCILYLSNMYTVSLQHVYCICPTCILYLSNMYNVSLQHVYCISPTCKLFTETRHTVHFTFGMFHFVDISVKHDRR